MTEFRTLKITKQAFKDTKTRKRQKGGYDAAPPPVLAVAAAAPPPNLIAVTATPANATLTSATPANTTPASAATLAKGGGLQLAPKKEKLTLAKSKAKRSTRKVVRIQMGNFRKSVKRAKDIVKESKEKTIEEIEEILVGAGIIKKRGSMSEGKKETLRGIYRDYLQLRSNAL